MNKWTGNYSFAPIPSKANGYDGIAKHYELTRGRKDANKELVNEISYYTFKYWLFYVCNRRRLILQFNSFYWDAIKDNDNTVYDIEKPTSG